MAIFAASSKGNPYNPVEIEQKAMDRDEADYRKFIANFGMVDKVYIDVRS